MKEIRFINMEQGVESIGPLSPREQFVLKLIYLRDDWEINEGNREYSKSDGHAPWYLALALSFEEARDAGYLPISNSEKVEHYLSWWVKDFGNRKDYPIVDGNDEIEKTKRLIQSVISSFNPNYPTDQNTSRKINISGRLKAAKSWFDGIPTRIVHSTDGPWKVRVGWFLGLAIHLDLLNEGKLIPNKAIKCVDDYLKWWAGLDRVVGEFVTKKEDIDRGNNVIDETIAGLEKEMDHTNL